MKTQPEPTEFERAIESRLRDSDWERNIAGRVFNEVRRDTPGVIKTKENDRVRSRRTMIYTYTFGAIAATVLVALGVWLNPANFDEWNTDPASSQLTAADALGDWMTVVDPGLSETAGYAEETYAVEPYLTLAVFEE